MAIQLPLIGIRWSLNDHQQVYFVCWAQSGRMLGSSLDHPGIGQVSILNQSEIRQDLAISSSAKGGGRTNTFRTFCMVYQLINQPSFHE